MGTSRKYFPLTLPRPYKFSLQGQMPRQLTNYTQRHIQSITSVSFLSCCHPLLCPAQQTHLSNFSPDLSSLLPHPTRPVVLLYPCQWLSRTLTTRTGYLNFFFPLLNASDFFGGKFNCYSQIFLERMSWCNLGLRLVLNAFHGTL